MIGGLLNLACLILTMEGSAASFPAGGNAWRITTANLTAAHTTDIVYACYDGAVFGRSATLDQSPLWKFDTGAFPYDLAAGDVDDDGKSEVFVASADGRLYCINADGTGRWTFSAPAALYQVAVLQQKGLVQVVTGGVDRKLHVLNAEGRLQKSLPWPRAIRLIRAGDLDGDGKMEIVVACWSGELTALRWPSLEVMWRKELRTTRREGSGLASWFPKSLTIEDLDGDGPCELIFGGWDGQSGLRVLSGDGSMRWETSGDFQPSDACGTGYNIAAVCKPDGLLGRRIVVLNGRYLFMLDRSGRIFAKGSAPVSFTDICRGEDMEGNATVYLASSPNGDDRIYRVVLDKGWGRSFASLHREGKMKQVEENLERIRRQILAYKGPPPANQRYVHFVAGGQVASAKQLEGFFSLIGHYRRLFPYPNCDFAIGLEFRPDEPVAGFRLPSWEKKDQVSASTMLDCARACEKAGVSFALWVGHGCSPWVPLELAKKVAQECPRSLIGFMSAEDDDYGSSLEHFIADYWVPLMQICRDTDKKAFLVEKHAWWVAVPAMKRFRALFDEKFRDVLVMSVEDSNTRSPELNMAGRLGLFLSGTVNNFSARTIIDEMCWNRLWDVECPMTGHPFLRRQIAQGMLGAKYFEYSIPLRGGGPARPGGFSVVGEESLDLICHLLGKGLLIPPTPAEMVEVSPQVIRMREPAAEFLRDAFNIHGQDGYVPDSVARDSPFEGLACYDGMAPVRPSYLGGYLLGVERHYDGFMPAAPFGLTAIVPSFVSRRRCPWEKGAWETDGRSWFEGTHRLTGLEARSRILQSFDRAAGSLPLRVEGKAFVQVQTRGPRILRATLIDPGFLDPADRPVKLHLRSDLQVNMVVDLLSGEALEIQDHSVALTVPAGAFRVIELQRPS